MEPLAKIKAKIGKLPSLCPLLFSQDNNFLLMNWDSERVHGGANETRIQTEVLLHLAEGLCVTPVINTHTRGDNILDSSMTTVSSLMVS